MLSKFRAFQRPDHIDQIASTYDQATPASNKSNLAANVRVASANFPSLLTVENHLDPRAPDDQAVHKHLAQDGAGRDITISEQVWAAGRSGTAQSAIPPIRSLIVFRFFSNVPVRRGAPYFNLIVIRFLSSWNARLRPQRALDSPSFRRYRRAPRKQICPLASNPARSSRLSGVGVSARLIL